MIWILVIASLIAAVSFYDFSWSNVTNNLRNEEVFKERHKSYGAYALRVEHGKQVMMAFTGVVILCSGLLFASKYIKGGSDEGIKQVQITDIDFTDLDDPETPKDPVQIPERTQEAPKFDLTKLIPPVAKNVVEEKDSVPTQDNLKDKVAGTANAKGDSLNGKDKIVLDTDIPIGDGKCKNCPEPGDKSISELTELPSFTGLKEYLQKNLKIPADAREIGIQGKVYVEFTIMADGSVSNVKVKKGLLESVDREAVRVIKNMPAKWEPGKINGHAVNVRLSQPITINVTR